MIHLHTTLPTAKLRYQCQREMYRICVVAMSRFYTLRMNVDTKTLYYFLIEMPEPIHD
jgi:hypothetical protein